MGEEPIGTNHGGNIGKIVAAQSNALETDQPPPKKGKNAQLQSAAIEPRKCATSAGPQYVANRR